MPATRRKSTHRQGILHALLPGARVDKNTKKIIVRVGTSNETIIFNVGGTIFETYKSTLRTIPNSPLGNNEFLAKHFRPDKQDHFFDRDPEIFHCILNYLRTGELHLPTSVCGPVVKSELEYWGVDEMDIEECCWNRYSTWASTLEALRKLENDRKAAVRSADYKHKENSSTFRKYCCKGWRFFSDPSSSTFAQIYAYFSLLIIFVSIFSFCAQTHEAFQVKESYKVHNTTTASAQPATQISALLSVTKEMNLSFEAGYASVSPSDQAENKQYFTVVDNVAHPSLYLLDVACVIYFLLELFCRFLVSPRKAVFVTLPMTITEFLALVPDLIDILARLTSSSYLQYRKIANVVDFLKVLRIFRIFRLMRHIPGLWILFYTLKSSVRDLLLLLLFVVIGMLVFSSLIYFAEHGVQEKFSSIPKCFWWSIVTMTTVGYGDMYPETNWGYLIGSATGISGVLMIGFTVPVLVNNFIMYYNHTRSTIRREKHRENYFNKMSNLHTPASLTCFSTFDDCGFGEKIIELNSFKVNKDSNDNEKGSRDGVVFNVGSSSIKTTIGKELSISSDDDGDDCKEISSF